MIKLNKGHCCLNGTISELCADIAVAIDSVAEVIAEKGYCRNNTKKEAVEHIISVAYAIIEDGMAQKENRP